MTVVTAVTITKQPVTTSVIIGSSLHLDCATDTPVNITWYAEGKKLNCTESCLVFNNNTLFINKTSIGDTGSYYCTLKDEAEVIKSDTVNVTVQFLILMPQNVKNISVYIDDTTHRMTCAVIGDPIPSSITWRHDGKAVVKDSKYNIEEKLTGRVVRSSLEISNFTSGVIGSYFCEAENSVLNDKRFAGQIVDIKESCKYGWKCPNLKKCIRSYLHCNNVDNCGDLSDETVNCSAPGEITSFYGRQKKYNSIQVYWRRDSRAIQYNLEFKYGGNVTTFVVKNARSKLITNLSNGTSYQLRVSAQNFAGESNKTKWINVTIPRVVPPGPVRNLTVVPFSVRYTYVKMDVQFLRPIESSSTYPAYYLRICHYNVTTKARVGCMDKNTYITTYYTESMRPESVYIVSVYAENKAKQRGPTVEHVFTTPAYKKRPKPQSNRSGLSGGAIAGIVVACLSAFTAIMGFLCKVCCSESDEEGGENMALNAK